MIEIGEFTYGHEGLRVESYGSENRLIIGKYCSIARDVKIFIGGNHRTDWISTYPFGHINQDLLGAEMFPGTLLAMVMLLQVTMCGLDLDPRSCQE